MNRAMLLLIGAGILFGALSFWGELEMGEKVAALRDGSLIPDTSPAPYPAPAPKAAVNATSDPLAPPAAPAPTLATPPEEGYRVHNLDYRMSLAVPDNWEIMAKRGPWRDTPVVDAETLFAAISPSTAPDALIAITVDKSNPIMQTAASVTEIQETLEADLYKRLGEKSFSKDMPKLPAKYLGSIDAFGNLRAYVFSCEIINTQGDKFQSIYWIVPTPKYTITIHALYNKTNGDASEKIIGKIKGSIRISPMTDLASADTRPEGDHDSVGKQLPPLPKAIAEEEKYRDHSLAYGVSLKLPNSWEIVSKYGPGLNEPIVDAKVLCLAVSSELNADAVIAVNVSAADGILRAKLTTDTLLDILDKILHKNICEGLSSIDIAKISKEYPRNITFLGDLPAYVFSYEVISTQGDKFQSTYRVALTPEYAITIEASCNKDSRDKFEKIIGKIMDSIKINPITDLGSADAEPIKNNFTAN